MTMSHKCKHSVLAFAAALFMSASVVQAQQVDAAAMMKQFEEMQRCMASVDQTAISQLEQQAKVLQTEVSALCAKGDESGARKKAMTFSKEVINSQPLQQIQRCTEKMGEMAKNMPNPMLAYKDELEKNAESFSICDSL